MPSSSPSSSTSYRPTKPPDSPPAVDDDDSDASEDLEIDLEELDPTGDGVSSSLLHNGSSSGSNNIHEALTAHQHQPQQQQQQHQPRPTRIALRNLRMGGGLRNGGGGGGGGGARNRGRYGELGRSRDESDAEGLLLDGDGSGRDEDDGGGVARYSDVSAGGTGGDEDDALLHSGYNGGASGGGGGRSRASRAQRRPRSITNDSLRSLSSRLRLPSFMSTASADKRRGGGGRGGGRGGAGEDQDQDQEDEDDEDQEEDDPSTSRHVAVGSSQTTRFPPNLVSNAKYTALSFLPVTLYNEFSFFFNMYFLLVALSQAVPALRIGYLSTYVAPLAFVLTITLGKEAYDDIERRRRDNEANSEAYTVVHFEDPGARSSSLHHRAAGAAAHDRPARRKLRSSISSSGSSSSSNARQRGGGGGGGGAKARRLVVVPERDRLSDIQEEEEQTEGNGTGVAQRKRLPSSYAYDVSKKSRDLKVGDVLKLSKGQRVPADVVILKCLSLDPSSGGDNDDDDDDDHNNNGAAAVVAPQDEPLLLDHVDEVNQGGSSAGGTTAAASAAADDTQTSGGAGGGGGGGSTGETFIRTDQLDGETDWKLRLASPLSQHLPTEELVRLRVTGGQPDRKVNEFVGTLELLPSRQDAMQHGSGGGRAEGGGEAETAAATAAPLSIDNTAWANTVIASHAITLAVIVYTGPQTRSALSTSPSRSKTGLLEYEINTLTKILCFLTLALSVILVALEGFGNTQGNVWYVKIMRFLVLFSTIVPISLRVNLDLGKSVYSWFIQRDPGMPGAVVRTSTIPEDLGRIEYLLSDKTGTLTQNEMDMKKMHVGTVSYANEAMDEVAAYVRQGFHVPPPPDTALVTPSTPFSSATSSAGGATRTRREIGTRVRDVVLALALCHNVTPTTEEVEVVEEVEGRGDGRNGGNGSRRSRTVITSYQASSPDEIAIVRWTESVGLRLATRDRKSMTLVSSESGRVVVKVRILETFPFTSEGKRMGIIVQFHNRLPLPSSTSSSSQPSDSNSNGDDGEIWFYQKGADSVMGSIVAANDWLDEETANMAREGLRTLVVGRKRLSARQYQEFAARHREASLSIAGREAGMRAVAAQHLERDLELLGVTGVEDKLQRDVKSSLELLRNAGIKIWMLTGDKVETARCVAVSAKLVARGQHIHTVARLNRRRRADVAAAQDHLDVLRNRADACLLIDGESLALFLNSSPALRLDFVAAAVRLPAVVACRCSPAQKADVARLIRDYTGKRVCCIGDGGNDVSMIQAADVGVGIVGKEGRQASLAADFSIEQFCHLTKLLVWHGRNSYKRSAKLAQFVIHRGLIIAVCQTMYSIALKFEPEGLYKDWLLVGYATIYTAAPVLSLVLDKDVDENLANLYPELYKELTSGRSLSYRTFFVWVFVSIYQGCLIQGLSQVLTEVDGPRMVAVSYTVLVLNELLMVAVEITTWHWIMVLSILGTFLMYVGSMPFLGDYFDLRFLITTGFLWRVAAILAISLVPHYAGKVIRRTMKPPSYRKVRSI